MTAVPNSGYAFVNWTQNGNIVSTSASYTFTLNGNTGLVANFAAPQYTVTVSASPSAGGVVVGGGRFAAGSTQKVTATANSGYNFVNWTQNGSVVSTATSYTFTLTANTTLVANFTAVASQYTVAVSALPSAGGTVTGGGTYAAGSTRTVTATANSGYSFVNWTQNGSAVSASPSYTFTLTSSVALVANFSSGSNPGFAWNPGMMSKGGIPTRTTVCATLAPGNGTADDSARIQSALDSCPSGQVVQLNAGTFVVNNALLVHSSITVRGAGAGSTILKKTNGARGRTSTVVSGTNGILTPVDPSSYTYDAQPIVIVGPSRWPGPDNSTSQALTSDGQQGAKSVTIANASGFAAGQFVLLDELSGATYQPTPVGFPGGAQVLKGDRVAWNIHNPAFSR